MLTTTALILVYSSRDTCWYESLILVYSSRDTYWHDSLGFVCTSKLRCIPTTTHTHTHAPMDMCDNNHLCRYCTNQLKPCNSYASALVNDTWASVLQCESQYVPSFSTWCMRCQRLSFICQNAFDDHFSGDFLVVHGPLTYQEVCVRESSFEAQVVLLRKLRELSLYTVMHDA